jgi:hypothetical protein
MRRYSAADTGTEPFTRGSTEYEPENAARLYTFATANAKGR